MSKSELIRFRCTENERKALETAANDSGLSISAYILNKLFVATKKEEGASVATKVVATKQKVNDIVATKEPQQNKRNTSDNEPAWKVRLKEQQEALKRSKRA